MHPLLREYETDIDAISGTMVRLCFSLPRQRNDLQKLAADSGVPLSTPMHVASFDPARADVIHSATIQDQLHSLSDGGEDEVLIGNVCVSYIYSLWEDGYRLRVAKLRGGHTKNEVRSDLFGELGAYRHAIIHNHAVGTSKTRKLMLLPPVPEGTAVRVDRHMFELLVKAVKKELHAISLPRRAA